MNVNQSNIYTAKYMYTADIHMCRCLGEAILKWSVKTKKLPHHVFVYPGMVTQHIKKDNPIKT